MNDEEKNFISQINLQTKVDKNITIHILKYSRIIKIPLWEQMIKIPLWEQIIEITLWEQVKKFLYRI